VIGIDRLHAKNHNQTVIGCQLVCVFF
jgi:hypothetical protein